ncbi:hypothetical protein [Tardiphaga sp.]|jgi:hypothetical protein|uniref:hypothetical protein n=1 Tax=Tardiphaga sp. TaxID=1926292 RepID=UPI0037DA6DB6
MSTTPNGQAMAKYTANQAVHAAKIASVEPIKGEKGKSLLTFENNFYTPAKIDTAGIATIDGKDPQPGDYYVVGADGEAYFEHPDTFEPAWKAST